ncbi:MAG TPA: hypothetical protein VNL18_15600 [Gemmatimonadales bacterium]|nr:hypothetical protein [Gemmatimonadales bacterium]
MNGELRQRPVLKILTCANPACGKRFKQKRAWQRYCSADCRHLDWERRNPRIRVSELTERGA